MKELEKVGKLAPGSDVAYIAAAQKSLFESDVDEAVRGLDSLLHLCFVREPEASDRYTTLGFNVSVPPFIRHRPSPAPDCRA